MIRIDKMKFMLLRGDMSQQEMARRTGLTQTTISNVGRKGTCQVRTFNLLLELFDVEPEELLADDFEL